MNEHYPFSLPPLPYDANALEPQLDATVIRIHHDRLFADYVARLNALLRDWPQYHGWSLEQLVHLPAQLPAPLREGVHNNAGGVYNHMLYFDSMNAPGRGGRPSPALAGAVERAFGSMDGLRRALHDTAAGQFASGYGWLLAMPGGELQLARSANQDVPLGLPLLNTDVWEHAYFLQYLNRRGDYLDAWWQLVDWDKVSARYEAALRTLPSYPAP